MLNSAALQCTRSTHLSRKFDWTQDVFCVGAAVRKPSVGSILWITGGGEQLVVWLDEYERRPMLNGVIGFPMLSEQEWYYYELMLERGKGQASLWLNNEEEVRIPIPTSMLGLNELTVSIGSANKSTFSKIVNIPDSLEGHFDDFYVSDGAKHGPVLVLTRQPTSQVNADPDNNWRGQNPSANAENLTQNPIQVAKRFNYHDQAGAVDEFRLSSTPTYEKAPIAQATVALLRMSGHVNFRVEVGINGAGGRVATSHKPGANWTVCFAQHPAFSGATFADYTQSTITLGVTG